MMSGGRQASVPQAVIAASLVSLRLSLRLECASQVNVTAAGRLMLPQPYGSSG